MSDLVKRIGNYELEITGSMTQYLNDFLNKQYHLGGDYIIDLATERHFYPDKVDMIDPEALEDAISGWYDDHDSWCLSVATTTRTQPLWGVRQIQKSWREAAKSICMMTYTVDNEGTEETYSISYTEVYGALADSLDVIFADMGVSGDVIDMIEAAGNIEAHNGIITFTM